MGILEKGSRILIYIGTLRNDKTNRQYAKKIAKRLAGLGYEVAMVDDVSRADISCSCNGIMLFNEQEIQTLRNILTGSEEVPSSTTPERSSQIAYDIALTTLREYVNKNGRESLDVFNNINKQTGAYHTGVGLPNNILATSRKSRKPSRKPKN